MQGAVTAPHTVATGRIQDTVKVYIDTPGSIRFWRTGYGVHIFVRNIPAAIRITETAAERFKVMLIPLVEEGQYLAVADTELGRAEFCLYLDKQWVREPRFACPQCQARGKHQNCPHNRHKPSEQARLLISVEFVIGGASVRPAAAGAGGKEGARYHPLYSREPRTGKEPTLELGTENSELGGNLHTAITGRSFVAGRKLGPGERESTAPTRYSVPLQHFLKGYSWDKERDRFVPAR